MTTEISAPVGAITDRRPDVEWELTDLVFFEAATVAPNQQRLYIVPASMFIPALGSNAVGIAGTGGFNLNDFAAQAVYSKPVNAWLPSSPAGDQITVDADLPFGNLKAVIALRDTFLGAYYWIVGDPFALTDPPSTPTLVTPAAAASVDTNLATIGMTLVTSPGSTPVRGEWQLATDAGFTANARTVTEPLADLRTSGITTEVIPSGSKLFAGTWFIRGRARNGGDEVSAWTIGHSFTVAHLPATTGHSPTGGVVLAYGAGFITFGWQFISSSPDQEQSAYRVVIEDLDANPVLDTTKVVSTDEVVVLEVDDDFIGVSLRWKVKVWDSEDVEGAYSDWQLVLLVEPGDIEITAPTEDEEIATALTVEWTHTPSDTGAVQAAYRVIVRVDDVDAMVVFDTGLIYSSETTLEVDPGVLENETAYTVEVIVRDTLDLESSDVQTFSVSWDAPDAVPFTVEASTFDTAGPVTILIDTTGHLDGDFAFLRVRRRVTDGEWVLVGDFTEAGPFVRVGDYRALPSRLQAYEVRQYAHRFGSLVASDAPVPVEITPPPSLSFWVIADDNRAVEDDTAPAIWMLAAVDSIRLEFASDDPHAAELERAEVSLRRRGRKVETGTVWGRRGTLSFTLLDDPTAHEQQLVLESFQTATPQLRKPNGEVFRVSFTASFSPQSRDDLVTAQLAYVEVA